MDLGLASSNQVRLPVVCYKFVDYCMERGRYDSVANEFLKNCMLPPQEIADRCGTLALAAGDLVIAVKMFTISKNVAGLRDCREALIRNNQADKARRASFVIDNLTKQ